MKTDDDYFKDWEAETFGFGYGTGELPVIMALHTFLENCPAEGCYDYEKLESALTSPVAWLLINILCRHEVYILEYGTSPRGAWLTEHGLRLKAYVTSKTVNELLAVLERDNDPSFFCARAYCNCRDEPCRNPFWVDHVKRLNTK
jgi:hypothetical protein